jgi:hypothetical protein
LQERNLACMLARCEYPAKRVEGSGHGGVRALVALGLLAAAATVNAGCGSARHASRPSLAERYVAQRMSAEMRDVGPTLKGAAGANPDVFVYCAGAVGATAPCKGTVTSTSSHLAVATQSWQVTTDRLGRVTSARALQEQLTPAGPVADALALDRAARLRALARRAGRHPRQPLATLSLKGPTAPLSKPPYVCIDNGHGKVLYQGILRAPRQVSVRAPHLRLNIGNSEAVVHVNGRIFRIPASPYGLSIFPGRVSYLPGPQRPCA